MVRARDGHGMAITCRVRDGRVQPPQREKRCRDASRVVSRIVVHVNMHLLVFIPSEPRVGLHSPGSPIIAAILPHIQRRIFL